MRGRPRVTDQMQQRRQTAGRYLKGLRPEGMTQVDLAEKLGLKYYTFVSNIEHGSAVVPRGKMAAWADALEVDRIEFVINLMQHYEPELYRILEPVFEHWRKRESRP